MIKTLEDAVNFLKKFHAPHQIDPGLSPENISPGLPKPLEFLYREMGSLILLSEKNSSPFSPPFGTQDFLIQPPGPIQPAGSFHLVDEQQSVCQWQVSPETPHRVECNFKSVVEESEERFDQIEETLDHFLITFSLSEAVMSAPHLECLSVLNISDAFLSKPNEMWLNAPYATREDRRSFYYFPNQEALVMDNESGIWVGSYQSRMDDFIDRKASTPKLNIPKLNNLPPLSAEEENSIMEIFHKEGRIQATYWLRDSRACLLNEANVLIGDLLERTLP